MQNYSDRLKVGSMFAGIGGICKGFQQAGFEIVWANDFDIDVIKTYKRNFGDAYIIKKDIRSLDAFSIPNIDILTAGFPCQSFSIAGNQKGFNDPRGNLFFQISKVIDIKRPQIIFLENVSNLLKHDNGKTFLVIYNTLVQFGYFIKYKIMDAQKYGNIPQRRERIYIIAFLNHEKCNAFRFPDEVQLKTKLNDFIDRRIKHCDYYYYNDNSFYYEDLKRIVTNKNAVYKINDEGVCNKPYYICQTLMANMGTFPDRIPVLCDNYGIRKMTPKEALLLQGFPNDFELGYGISLNAAYRQIGNSVCLPVVHRIAERIKLVAKNN